MPQAQPPRWGKILILPARSYNNELQPPIRGREFNIIYEVLGQLGSAPYAGEGGLTLLAVIKSRRFSPLYGEKRRYNHPPKTASRVQPPMRGKEYNGNSTDSAPLGSAPYPGERVLFPQYT